MILLYEVAQKIQNILNGVDQEVNVTAGLSRPVDYEFQVQTTGFHIDSIADTKSGKNFIPVFISTLGGSINPVPNLNEATYTVPLTFYFPVGFKNDLMALQTYLADVFVGQIRNYGTNSGKALSNISVPRFGEITEFDLTQFKEWVEQKYRQTIEGHEPYFSMEIVLYLSTAGSDFIYGNEIKGNLSYTLNESTLSDDLVFDNSSLQGQCQPQSEQLEGEGEAQGLPLGMANALSFKIYYKNTTFYQNIIEKWWDNKLNEIDFNLTITLGTFTYSRTCYIESIVMPLEKGQLITLTVSFAKKVVEETTEVVSNG